MLIIQELIMANFEFVMSRDELFWKFSDINLHLIILDGNHFFHLKYLWAYHVIVQFQENIFLQCPWISL